MGPVAEGIIIGGGGILASGTVTLLGASMIRMWRTPKRVDRIETVIPVLARGMWAVLKMHVAERNGNTDEDIKQAYAELTKVVTDGVISRKSKS